MPPPPGHRVEPAEEETRPAELEAGVLPAHRPGVLFELQQLPGRPAVADAHDDNTAGRSEQPASERNWYAGVDLDDTVGFIKGLDRSLAAIAGRGRGDGGDIGYSNAKGHGHVRRLNPVRRRPAERLASAVIFAAFVAVAALVGVICVSSLSAAYQDEKNTEDLLHDARAFVPAKPGGTLPVDSFEDVQQPNRNMGHELNRLYTESAHHNWAGHDFDVAFVDGDLGQEAKSTQGRTQDLASVPKPVHTIEAPHHVHGKRVWGWLHKKSAAADGEDSSADIQESLDKQADYIIGYPDLADHSPARTEGLVQRPHGSRIGKGMMSHHIPALKPMAPMHKVQSLGTLPPLSQSQHEANVRTAQQVWLSAVFSACASCLLSCNVSIIDKYVRRTRVQILSTGVYIFFDTAM
jgi:hypothetical protein